MVLEEEILMSRRIVEINHDSEIECPSDFDGAWTLYSFCSKHQHFKHPEHLCVQVGRNQVGWIYDPVLKAKLENGLAHWLGYFEHGQSCWFRTAAAPPGVEFQWDGVRYAGLLVWEKEEDEIGAKSYEDRAKDADSFLRQYTDWANGHGVWFSISNSRGDLLDSGGGYYASDLDFLLEEIAREVKGHEFVVTGDYEYLQTQLEAAVKKLKEKPRVAKGSK